MVVSAAFLLGWLAVHGCSAACGAGIVGNFQAESSLEPCISSSMGVGLPQWMGDRATKFLNRFGNDWCRAENQLIFVVQELDQMGIKGRLFSETNPRRAAALFMKVFERPKKKDAAHVNHRSHLAEALYRTQRGA